MVSQTQGAQSVDTERVARLKTATYTCTVPLLSGAVLAGAGAAERRALEAFGDPVGIAFQLVDDLLGVFGDPGVTGKSVLSDLREGKRTHLLAITYRRADGRDRELLDRLVGDPDLDETGAEQVRGLMVRHGAVDAVRDRVDELVRRALDATDALPPALRDELTSLTHRLTERAA
nr:polyprenyl synthetase family protein [Paraoerskovia sediminicola]